MNFEFDDKLYVIVILVSNSEIKVNGVVVYSSKNNNNNAFDYYYQIMNNVAKKGYKQISTDMLFGGTIFIIHMEKNFYTQSLQVTQKTTDSPETMYGMSLYDIVG